MPWSYRNGKFYFVNTPVSVEPTPAPAPNVTTTHILTGDENLTVGAWAEWTGNPSMTGGTITTWKHSEAIDHAHSHLRLAQEGSELVAGIVFDNQVTIQETGVCLAWVIKPIKNHIPLTGIYAHTINGLNKGKMVLIHNELDDSFLMAKTKDDELTILAEKFHALTNN